MTSTSLHVLGAQQDYALRRKELQELKRLQRREARDQQLLNDRNEFEKDTQEKKFNEYRSVGSFLFYRMLLGAIGVCFFVSNPPIFRIF